MRRINRKRKTTEHDEQAAFVAWCRYQEQNHPMLRYLYAIPNGGHMHIAQASKLKAEGVRAGVCDLHLPVPRGISHGLWLEFKSKTGTTTDAQKVWIESMRELGHAVYVVRSWEVAAQTILEYLHQPPARLATVAIGTDADH